MDFLPLFVLTVSKSKLSCCLLFLNHGGDSLKCCLEKDSEVINGIIEKD